MPVHNYVKGLIFTSPRCAESVKRAISSNDSASEWEVRLRDSWIAKPIYCVGPSTKDAVTSLFNHLSSQESLIFVSDKGNSESLGHKISERSLEHPVHQPLLYPCGNLKTDTLGSILNQHKIPFRALTVYETVQNPELEKILEMKRRSKETTKDQKVYVFFSPSGLKNALPFLTELETAKFVALGPTTRQALEKIPAVNSTCVYQCASPTPEALVALLQSL